MHTVIIGAGFGGIRALNGIAKDPKQRITLVDRNDYNFFPPLIYQVAAGFLAPSDISYPLRKFITGKANVRYRQGSLQAIDTTRQVITLDNGELHYDRLVLAIGAEPNFFGNVNIAQHALPMKSLRDALSIRNHLLHQFNQAASVDKKSRESYVNIVIAGGGPSGVELAGVLSEIRMDIFKHEYPELQSSKGGISLVTADPVLLAPMQQKSQQYAKQQLQNYGVALTFDDTVSDYDATTVTLGSGRQIPAKTLIWTAGVRCHRIEGLNDDDYGRGQRLVVDQHLRLPHYDNIYAIGDIALATHEPNYAAGHPQLGQVAMSQGIYLGRYLRGATDKPYVYKHRGDMAMIGRMKAVADLKSFSVTGFMAWLSWVWVHIIALITVRNRIATAYDWMIAFFTCNQSLRMGITPDVTKLPDRKI